MGTAKLDQQQVARAVRRLSARGRYWFTRRHLFYELRRRGLVDSTVSGDAEMDRFAEVLDAYEGQHGRLERLVRPEEVPAVTAGPPLESDILDYAVRRVIVFEHLDLLLMFAKSGFHHKMVVALATADGFPAHVWGRLREQLDAGLTTTFYALHDCTSEGYGLRARLAGQLAGWERARTADAGLHLAHAMELGVPLRRGPPVAVDAETVGDPKEASMLAEGSYAHFEAIRPLRAMRWVFGRLVRRAEDAGFG
ncbi:MAG: hypothetical protein DRI90_24625 [Deltaproteobacteria bacterium]|nr:MAG: hypothetical protein DRI90_24625 [Deltaproteobacteria bacterium]